MADYETKLRPTPWGSSPYVWYDQTVTGVDQLLYTSPDWLNFAQYFTLVSARVVLTTDATVANRFVHLQHKLYPHSSGLIVPSNFKTDAIAASSSKVTIIGDFYLDGAGASFGFDFAWGIGKDLIFANGEFLVIFLVDTGKAGDTLRVVSLWRYRNWDWNLPTGMPGADAFYPSRLVSPAMMNRA